MKSPFPFITILAAAALCLAFHPSDVRAQEHKDHDHDKKNDVETLIAVLQPTIGNDVKGTVHFKDLGDGKVEVTAKVEGLDPGSKHGFHVHEYGDITAPDGTATGGHFNPDGHDHALPEKETRHAGDFGNLEVNEAGVADFKLVVDNITLTDGKNAVIGRGVIVHAKPDDGGQPTGNAGPRVAQGVIGVANPDDK